jgi:hypothetical protein
MRKLFLVLAGFALVIAACSSGAESSDTTVPVTLTTTSTTPPETTTTVAVETTTTTVADTSTTSSVPDTTTTTSDVTDTTFELSNEGIQAGSTWVHFGYDADDAVDAFEVILGPPTDDTGWLDSVTDGWETFGVCPGPHVRGVTWGTATRTSLQVLFTDGDTDFWTGGVEHFFTFYYFDGSNPTDVKTTEGIGVGSSVGQLKAAYDGPDFVFEEAFFDPSQGYWSYKQTPWTGLWGYTSGLTDAFVVTSINGGQGCGE